MVSSQVLLGVAVGSLLLLIGGYTLYLWRRLAAVEAGGVGRQREDTSAGANEEDQEPVDP